MNGESETTTAFGLRGTTGWFVGGALGGAIGAVAFGIVMVLLEPGVLEAAIPAIYGLEPAGPLGWGIHIAHGIVLGLLFGLLGHALFGIVLEAVFAAIVDLRDRNPDTCYSGTAQPTVLPTDDCLLTDRPVSTRTIPP